VPNDFDYVAGTGTVTATFPVKIDRFDREKFQAEGHFVPRMVDAEQRPREWEGPIVFVATIFHELRDAMGTLQSRVQVLRVLADTPEELQRLMGLRIRETFFALFAAQQVQTGNAELLKKLHDENNALRGTGFAAPKANREKAKAYLPKRKRK